MFAITPPKIDNTSRHLSSILSATTDTGHVSFDPTGGSARRKLQRRLENRIEMGLVVRSGCGTYDCSVKIGSRQVACIALSRGAPETFGLAAGTVPVEGSYVLVLVIGGSSNVGYILGTIPSSWRVRANDTFSLKVPASYPNDIWDPWKDNSSSNLPFKPSDKKYDKIMAQSNRRRDIHPGEATDVNENNCGTTVTMYAVELSGGASYVRVSRLDDEIRIRSSNYQRWSNHIATWEFNDAGLISNEGREYSYQGELLGTAGRVGPPTYTPSETDAYEPRPRTRFWKGFLGNLFSWFVIRARSKKGADDEETLAHVHVSQAGNISVRSASGISLEKYAKIPIPNRLMQPWDPQGDREIDATHKAFEAFVMDDPHARGIAESSKIAWDQKIAYQRFDELKKDFKVKNENDVNVPGDADQDPFGSRETKQAENKDRKAGVFIGEDGSVIIRDAWGSEITMLGGNILVNTPGNIIQTANRDIVSIARKSAIIRGTQAAEMSSEEQDVRIHAKKLVAIAGGTKDSLGGVLIQSLASGPVVNAPAKAGSKAQIGGVVIRSEDAGVLISGKNAYVNGKQNVFVTGGTDGGTRDGNVFIDGKAAIVTGAEIAGCIVESSTVIATNSFAGALSPGSAFVYGDSAMIMNGNTVPILWDEAGEPPDLSDIQETWKTLQDSEITVPYDWDNVVEKAVFSFRTSVQARTDTGIEPWRPNKEFTLYEPYWQVLHDVNDPFASNIGVPYTPQVEEVHGTKCWPYLPAIDSGKFVKYGSGNIEDGFSKPRDAVKNTMSVTRDSMSSFKV